MPPRTTTRSTGRFIDFWAYLALATTGSLLLAAIVAGLFVKPLAQTTLQVTPKQTAKLPPINLKPSPIGALRIDVKASVPTNRRLTYDVQIQDQEGKLLAAGRTQTGQDDNSLDAGLDLLSDRSEPIVVAIAISDYSTRTNQPITQPVRFRVNIKNGVIDHRYLWGGFWGSLLLAGLAIWSVRTNGIPVINHTYPDSDLNARAILGGRRDLLEIKIKVRADETAPNSLNCQLIIKDGMGQRLYDPLLPISLSHRRDEDGEIQDATGSTSLYLVLKQRSSYGFYIQINPDQSVESTQLIVKEGTKTLRPISVVEIETS